MKRAAEAEAQLEEVDAAERACVTIQYSCICMFVSLSSPLYVFIVLFHTTLCVLACMLIYFHLFFSLSRFIAVFSPLHLHDAAEAAVAAEDEEDAESDADDEEEDGGELILFTVTLSANPAHNLT